MDVKQRIFLVLILVISGFLRFFNLMHDSPYFFNPDERNMANAISQFRLPSNLSKIPICLISQISLNKATTNDCNLNPHFFSYGQFPLYLAFTSDQIIKPISNLLLPSQPTTHNSQLTTSFPSAIFWLRFYSALSSTLTILLVYLVTNILVSSHSGKRGTSASRISLGSWTSQDDNLGLNIGHYAAIIAAFTPGLIQSAHFGTTESFLTFFFLVSVYLSLRFLSNLSNLKFVLLTSLTIGLALGSKLTGIFFFVPPIIALLIKIKELSNKKGKKKLFIGLLSRRCLRKMSIYSIVDPATAGGYWVIGLLLVIGSITIFFLSSPYNLVEPESFRSAVFGYESDVATGKYEAFYTRQFVHTTPIIFQIEKVFPYVLGWPVFTLGTVGLLLISISLTSKLIQTIVQSIRYQVLRIRNKKKENKNILNTYYLILTTSFMFYLLPNSFLFAKWTRFMIPILPFFSIFAGYFIFVILGSVNDSRITYNVNDSGQARMTKRLVYWIIGLLVFISILPGISFMSIYSHEDTRISASKWIYQNIPNNSYVLSETANVVDIPLGLPNNEAMKQWNNVKVISFDFYRTDENPTILFTQLLSHLEKADYIFIPSRRIFANYTKLPQKYPLITKYYQLLFSGRLGFEKVKEFSILSDENAEETFTVFDHPVIRIYKKTKPFTIDQYRLSFNKVI